MLHGVERFPPPHLCPPLAPCDVSLLESAELVRGVLDVCLLNERVYATPMLLRQASASRGATREGCESVPSYELVVPPLQWLVRCHLIESKKSLLTLLFELGRSEERPDWQ